MQLYRCYDTQGRLLYVGVTSRVSDRLVCHRSSSPFWRHVVQTVVSEERHGHFAARVEEREAIAAERPLFNLQSNPDYTGTNAERVALYSARLAAYEADDIDAALGAVQEHEAVRRAERSGESALYLSVQAVLEEPLPDFARSRRMLEPKRSWRRIAMEITERTGIELTGEALRVWLVPARSDEDAA